MNGDLVKAKTPDDFDLKFKAIGAMSFRIIFCCKNPLIDKSAYSLNFYDIK